MSMKKCEESSCLKLEISNSPKTGGEADEEEKERVAGSEMVEEKQPGAEAIPTSPNAERKAHEKQAGKAAISKATRAEGKSDDEDKKKG